MRHKLELPFVPLGSAIPRVIHQTFASKIPDTLKNAVENLTAQNPQWEHRLYTDKDVERFILLNYGKEYHKIYKRISPRYGAARADFFRYLLMYRVGGVYLDIKSSFSSPIDEVLSRNESYILAKWRNRAGEVHEGWGLHDDLKNFAGGEFQQWHIIAAPGHPFLRAVLDRVTQNILDYDSKRSGVGWSGVLTTTGPIAYTMAIAPLVKKFPCTVIPDESCLSMTYSVLDQSSHISLFKSHYLRNSSPVVYRAGFRGLTERIRVALGSSRHHIREFIRYRSI